jgi:drug/metabolite transporter (DMT)-like permease
VPAFARLTTAGASSLAVAAVTAAFGAAAAAAVLAARRELRRLVERPQALRLAAVGLLGTALAYVLFFEGARRTSATTTVLCLQSEPVYALLASWAFLGHRLTLRRVGAALLLASGIALAVGTSGRADPVGVAALLATPVCWQLSHLVVLRGLAGVAPTVLTGARYLWGGLFLALYWLLRGGDAAAELPASGLPLLALQGVLLYYVGTLLWYQTIARLDLARATAIVVPAIPILSTAASFALLGEIPTPRQWAGLVLAAAGVAAFVRAPHAVEESERVPSPTAPLAVPGDPTSGGNAA